MTTRILVLEGLSPAGLDVLRAEGWEVDVTGALDTGALSARIGPYDALTVRSGSRVTADVLARAPKLRAIGRPGIGLDNVDVDAATRLGIVVMNTPDANVVATAELTLGLLFALARNIPQADAAMKAARWERKAFTGVELCGRRLGIVGLRRVGRAVAQRARALGMDVVGCDPQVPAADAQALDVLLLPFHEVAASADFLTLHAALTPASRGLVSRAVLSRVRPGVRIVNAARGELVDEQALLEALESGRVAGAALDVWAAEPPPDWRLARHPNVVATPHLGGATAEAQERVSVGIAEQVRDFLKDGVIRHAVNVR